MAGVHAPERLDKRALLWELGRHWTLPTAARFLDGLDLNSPGDREHLALALTGERARDIQGVTSLPIGPVSFTVGYEHQDLAAANPCMDQGCDHTACLSGHTPDRYLRAVSAMYDEHDDYDAYYESAEVQHRYLVGAYLTGVSTLFGMLKDAATLLLMVARNGASRPGMLAGLARLTASGPPARGSGARPPDRDVSPASLLVGCLTAAPNGPNRAGGPRARKALTSS